jgi:fatty acid desaturase
MAERDPMWDHAGMNQPPALRGPARALWLALGWLLTGFGFAGTVVPLLPATPFFAARGLRLFAQQPALLRLAPG